MKRFIRQRVCFLFLCLLLCGLFCVRAAAVEKAVDTGIKGSLTVSYTYGTDADSEKNLVLAGVSFRIYRVAAVNGNGIWSLMEDFTDSGVTNEQLNTLDHAQDVNEVVDTLVVWIKEKESGTEDGIGDQGKETESESETGSDNTENGQKLKNSSQSENPQTGISACQTALTDETGTAVFENLETGMYLLIGDSLTNENMVYSNSPSLISIPSVSSDGTGWEYEITINAKAEATSVLPDSRTDTETPSELSTEAATEMSTETATELQTETATEASTEGALDTPSSAYMDPGGKSSDGASSEYSTEIVTDTKTETGSAESETTDANAVQTGDDTPIMAWLLLLCGAFAVLVAGMRHRRQSG